MTPVDGDLVVTRSLTVRAGDLSERFSRSSGPGGQGVNTADSRVELSYDVANAAGVGPTVRARLLERLDSRLVDGVLTIAASEHRTQLANRRAARERLVEILREAAAPPPKKRRPTKPTRGSQERRLAEKKRRGETKQGRRARWD
jgi:ribosome-associated protein